MKHSATHITLALGTFLAGSCAFSAVAQAATVNSIAQLQYNNGSLITLNGQLIPADSGLVAVNENDIIEMGRGFTDFDLLMSNPSQVLWDIQVFPGDRSALFTLDDYVVVDTEQTFRDVTNLPSGRGNVIAVGDDPENPSPVVLRPFSTQSQPMQAVPEPSTGLGILVAVGITYMTRKKISKN